GIGREPWAECCSVGRRPTAAPLIVAPAQPPVVPRLRRFRVFGDRQEHRRPIRHTRPTVSKGPVGTARARRRLGLRPRLSPDGRLFVEGSWQGDLLVRSAETGDVVLRERLQGMVPQIAATGDRLHFAYAVIGPPGPS